MRELIGRLREVDEMDLDPDAEYMRNVVIAVDHYIGRLWSGGVIGAIRDAGFENVADIISDATSR